MVDRAVRIVLDTYPNIGITEKLGVRLGFEYDIGIHSGVIWQMTTQDLSPYEWRKRLERK